MAHIITDHTSPNFDSRDGHEVDMLVLHYTGMQTGQAALERLCEAEAKVSAHYLVEEDGRIFQLVQEGRRAWHAGVAEWRGHRNINQRSIGVEIVNPGHEFGYRAFPEAQMESVIVLCHDILGRYRIPKRNVVGHSDVAPMRKQDPGELFPWEMLAGEGIGLRPLQGAGFRIQGSGRSEDYSLEQGQALESLNQFGYGYTDENNLAVITAFQRHFRPEKLGGVWDEDCAQRLASLLSMI